MRGHFELVVGSCEYLAKWIVCFFFFNDTATTEIYTLSLHDALPILNDRFIDTVPLRNTCTIIVTKSRADRDQCHRCARDLLEFRSQQKSQSLMVASSDPEHS